MMLVFDQRVGPGRGAALVLARAGADTVPLRLATAASRGGQARRAPLRRLPAGQWLAFRAIDALPRDANVRVSVGPGTPSAEGSGCKEVEQYWEFRNPWLLPRNRLPRDSCARGRRWCSASAIPATRVPSAPNGSLGTAIARMEAWVSEDL